MSLFDELVTFLENKVQALNHRLKTENNMFHDNPCHSSNNLSESLHTYNFLQNEINNRLKMLQAAARIKSGCKDEVPLTNKVSEYLHGFAEIIVQEQMEFSTEHPLYGFKEFHTMLIDLYSEQENYEKCLEVNKLYQAHELKEK